jgi:hypothetical protein
LQQQRLAYHLADIETVLGYAEQAVIFAKESGNDTATVLALKEFASAYEWPMDHMKVYERREKALELAEEAEHILVKRGDAIERYARPWVYISLAKFQALNGLEEEAQKSIGEAQKVFVPLPAEIPGLHLSEANLIRQEGIVYAYLGQQGSALANFLQLAGPVAAPLVGVVPPIPWGFRRSSCGGRTTYYSGKRAAWSRLSN